MKKHAILLPGQLRCIDENLLAFLDTCKASAQIFIVTDQSYKEDADKLVNRYEANLLYIEDAHEQDMGIPKSDFHLIHPESIKLEVSLRHLLAWEKSNRHAFEYIHRFRTDIIYPIDFESYIQPITDAGFNEKTLLTNWNLNYSGSREAMLRLIGHGEFQVKYKQNRDFFNHITTRVNVEALENSSNAMHFVHTYPVAILSSKEAIPNYQNNIRKEFSSYIDAAASFARRLRLESIPEIIYQSISAHNDINSLVRTYSDHPWNPLFPEHLFFLHLNTLDLSTGSYSLKQPWIETPLKYSRHATTPFTVKIFNQIQAKDYSFLEPSMPWEYEIDMLKASEARPGAALQKFSLIDISMLSDSACKTLYHIIDLLNQPDYLTTHRSDFVESIMSRDIEPPSCLKIHCLNHH